MQHCAGLQQARSVLLLQLTMSGELLDVQSRPCTNAWQCLQLEHLTAQVILKDVSSQAALSPGVQAAGAKDADAPLGQVPPLSKALSSV